MNNQNSLDPIILTPAPTAGKGRVDLVKSDFDAAIENKGLPVYLDRVVWCPCRRVADRQPLSSCKNCGGSGYVYINRFKTTMMVQAMNVSTKFKDWSEEKVGTVRITARDEDNIAFMDRITVIGVEMISSQVIFPKEFYGEVKGKLIYEIKSIQEIFTFEADSKKLVKLEINADYTIDGNVLNFNSRFSTWENFTVTVRYKHEPSFHVIDMVRDSMTTKILSASGETSVEMPVSAVGRRSHYVLDEQNYSGDYLLDNSYDLTGCGGNKEIEVPPPTMLRLSNPTATEIALTWVDPSEEELYNRKA